MKFIERIQCAEKIVGEYRDILGIGVNDLRHEAGVNSVADIETTIASLRNQGRTLQIGIIGRVKAGKSSLLNALFFGGASVLPHAATPMTAALTTLGHGDRPRMRAEFFTNEELQKFRNLHEEHEKAIDDEVALLERRSLQRTSQMTSNKQRIPSSVADESVPRPGLRELAKKKIDKEDISRHSGWEMWESIKKVGGENKMPHKEDAFDFNNIDELRVRLADYVGTQGHRTPFTKCMHLELPFDSLRDLQVVDTPGLSDPIVSRERRTQLMLHECDAVFIVSPAGQFLNKNDEELMERLSTREGVRTFYVVASQFDTQLFGHEYQVHAGDLRQVIQTQQESLAGHASRMLSSWAQSNPSLAPLASDVVKALRISSSTSYALLETKPECWDETTRFVHGQLRTKYPDYFSIEASSQEWLKQLSGIPRLENDLFDIRKNKLTIFEKRTDDYVGGQENASRYWIQSLLKYVEKRNQEFESSDIATVETRLQRLANISLKGEGAANVIFAEQAEERSLEIVKEIKRIVREQFKESSSESSHSLGHTRERAEKGGVGPWLARALWGGGYEDISVQTVETKIVRDAIANFHDVLRDDLNIYIEQKNIRWRDEISKLIISRLRDVIGDEYVSGDDVRRVTKATLLSISDLPEPQLPELPEDLSATGRLKGVHAKSFMEAAEKYLDALKEAGYNFSHIVKGKLKKLQETSVGTMIFSNLQEEAESLKSQLQHKRLTVEKYARLQKALEDASA